jgi:hypothetical protein
MKGEKEEEGRRVGLSRGFMGKSDVLGMGFEVMVVLNGGMAMMTWM